VRLTALREAVFASKAAKDHHRMAKTPGAQLREAEPGPAKPDVCQRS